MIVLIPDAIHSSGKHKCRLDISVDTFSCRIIHVGISTMKFQIETASQSKKNGEVEPRARWWWDVTILSRHPSAYSSW